MTLKHDGHNALIPDIKSPLAARMETHDRYAMQASHAAACLVLDLLGIKTKAQPEMKRQRYLSYAG